MALNLTSSLFDDVMEQQTEDKAVKESKNIEYVIINVDPNKICENKFNDIYDSFSQNVADEQLKNNIIEHGLLENLVVTPNTSYYCSDYDTSRYEYRVISGHRRLRAIKQIIAENYQEAKRFISVPVKVETYNSQEEELLALNSYNLHSRTLTAEDKLKILADIRAKLETMSGEGEPTKRQKNIRNELKKYDSIFEGMASATKRRYMSISANSNTEIVALINDGFTIHQLAKISTFPGKEYNPFLSLLCEKQYSELEDELSMINDLQNEIIIAVNYLKENGFWNNDMNIKNWRNYIISNFVNPVHQALVTIKSNCSAYNIAEAQKDRENAISKIHHQIHNIEKIKDKFISGYTSGMLTSQDEQEEYEDAGKTIISKIENDIDKISDLESLRKVIQIALNRGAVTKTISSEVALNILKLL